MQSQFPDWWIRAGGSPYPAGVQASLLNELEGMSANASLSALIIRDQQHALNLSGGKETFIPSRLLYGAIPQALLDAYLFWRDESVSPRNMEAPSNRDPLSGYQRLRGYPVDKDGEHIIFVEIQNVGSWERYTGVKAPRVGPHTATAEFTLECTGKGHYSACNANFAFGPLIESAYLPAQASPAAPFELSAGSRRT